VLCKPFVLFASMLVFASSRAQVIFQDSFEYTDPDPYYMYNRGGWAYTQGSLRPEEGEGPSFPVGPNEGIQPKTGNKMFDLRASTFALQERELYHDVRVVTTAPVTECTLAFCYRPSVTQEQNLFFRVQVSNYFALTATINAQRDSMTVTGTSQPKSVPVALVSGFWYTYKVRVEWANRQTFCGIEGQTPIRFNMANFNFPRDIAQFHFGIRPLANTQNTFDKLVGAPGAFIDDYRVASVPESPSIVVFALAVACVVRSRRRT